MLAKSRKILRGHEELESTPLLVPSFSSKGFPEVEKIIGYNSELITGPALVSAYDLYHRKINPPFEFPSLLFLDSGGYEASKDTDLSDLGDTEYAPALWRPEYHESILKSWNSSVPTIFISYDHPKERLPIKEQIDRAHKMEVGGDGLREILLKPETEDSRFLKIDNVLRNIHGLADFSIIGVTEKEIGGSIADRMLNIAKLRNALEKAGMDTPIHVFGSLDTMTTPMYFIAGADIFDGLTWLRFAYYEGSTMYKHNFSAVKLGLNEKSHTIDGRCWNNNLYYMRDMELEMRRFLVTENFETFKHHGSIFSNAWQNLLQRLGG